MEVKEIKDIIEFLSNTGLEEVDIETKDLKVRVRRSCDQPIATLPPPLMTQVPTAVQPSPPIDKPESTPSDKITEPKTETIFIKSPMIGTFYRSSNPENPAFVSIGDEIKKGDTVCIIEAMKLFNEIESEVNGKVVRVMVDNATPVEFDQPLFEIDPS